MPVKVASVKKGTATSIVSAIASAASLFIVFRVSIDLYSAALIGCWALIQGFFLVARIADTGAGSNITRILSQRIHQGAPLPIGRTLAAALLITSLPVAFISFILYFPISLYVGHRFESTVALSDIKTLTLLSAGYAVISCTATIMLSAVEGIGRLHLKNYVIIASNVAALPSTFFLLGYLGFSGLGYIYLIMGGVQLVGAVAILMSGHSSSGVPSANVSIAEIIKLLWRENAKLSGIALLRLTFEPVTKFLLSAVGTLDDIAAFELALRVSTQIRTLVQSAAQPLLVAGSSLVSGDRDGYSGNLFWKYSALIGIASALLLEVQIIGAPVIGLLGLGQQSTQFVIYFVILALSGSLNTVGLAGYFYQLSSGKLDPLTRIHMVMALVNAVGGMLAAFFLGSVGVVFMYGLSFSLGGILCLRLLTRTAHGSRVLQHFRSFWGPSTLARILFWLILGVFISTVGAEWSHLVILAIVLIESAAWILAVYVFRKKLILTIVREG